MICTHASDFEVIPRREAGRVVDFDVRTFCKGCGERDCACPDPIYAGICPALNGAAEPFHARGDTRG